MAHNLTDSTVHSSGFLSSIFSLPHFWLKLICVLATFVAMQLVGLLALIIMRRLRVRRVDRFRAVQSYTLCTAAGVLLGSCFLGLFPAIRSSLDIFLSHADLRPDTHEHSAPQLASLVHMPCAEVFEVLGFILVWLLESLFQMAMQHNFERRARLHGAADDNDFVAAAGVQPRAGRAGASGHPRDKPEYMALGLKGRGKARSRGGSHDQQRGLLARASSSSESTDEDSGNYTRGARKNQQQQQSQSGNQQNQSRTPSAPKPQALPSINSNNDLPAGCHDVGDFSEIAATGGTEDALVGGSASANMLVHSALVDVQLKVCQLSGAYF